MHVSGNIKIISWFNFFSAFKIYSAFAVIYFTQVTQSVALGISIISIAQIAGAAFELPTGILSDKIGRKPVLILGALTRLVSLVCYAIAPEYWIFVVGAVFEGLALALFSGNNEALLYDTVNEIGEKQKYHTYLGQVKSMAYPSLLIASLLGGVVATISFPFVFWLSTIPQTICVFLAFMIVEPKRHSDEIDISNNSFRQALRLLYRNIQLRRLSMAEVFTQGIEEVLFQMQLLFYNMLWPVWAVGLTRSMMAFGKFISFRYSSLLIGRFGATTILVYNTLISRVIHIVSIVFPTIASPIFMTSTSLLWGTIEVSKNKLLQDQFSSTQRATMSSVLSFMGSIFAGLLGLIVGLVSDRIGIVPTLLILQLFFVPILMLYIKFGRSYKSED
jgi:MFS family permease